MGERRPGPTKELDRDELQRLARESTQPFEPGQGDAAAEVATPLSAVAEGSEPTRSRTNTLHDPMTMALLAEVARSSRTIDLDPETLARVTEETVDVSDAPHPHVKRRG